ncbi:hypothetical protein DFQ28_002812 [Apophysomyces sp. BC1034]|nr:hypothetical protein DFQ29_005636 [Apophysomyces sp. BC1021]KAG0189868.1 hypothetical protein DFQ28_002812 [Apophysomyces sp. BC1034]
MLFRGPGVELRIPRRDGVPRDPAFKGDVGLDIPVKRRVLLSALFATGGRVFTSGAGSRAEGIWLARWPIRLADRDPVETPLEREEAEEVVRCGAGLLLDTECGAGMWDARFASFERSAELGVRCAPILDEDLDFASAVVFVDDRAVKDLLGVGIPVDAAEPVRGRGIADALDEAWLLAE